MSVPNPAHEWWNLPVEQIPESAQLQDMPPLLQALVRRNAALRRQLLDCHASLRKAEPEAIHQREAGLTARIAELERFLKSKDEEACALRLENDRLVRSDSALKQKLDDFRGMIERRDKKIAKLKGK